MKALNANPLEPLKLKICGLWREISCKHSILMMMDLIGKILSSSIKRLTILPLRTLI